MQKTNTPLSLLILFLGVSLMAGCSQRTGYFKYPQPGKYQLISLKSSSDTPDSFDVYKVHTKIIHASSDTVHPSEYSVYLLEHTEIHDGESVLDIGTATGVQTMFAADKASHVLAMDISPEAIKVTAHNAQRLGVADKVSVRVSDLFNALAPDEKFDVIISSIPFPIAPTNQRNWKLQERFFRDAGKHLNPNGRIYFSTVSLANMPRTQSLAEKNGLKIVRINMDYYKRSRIEHVIYVFKHEKHAKGQDKDLVPQN